MAARDATSPLRRAARAEWGPLWTALRDGLRGRGPRAIPLTLTAVALTALCWYVQQRSWGGGLVHDLGVVRAADPWWLSLLRTPPSLFVPAPELPVWGALTQLLLVGGISEVCVGRTATVLVGCLATLAGTLYARIGIAVGPGGAFGLPASDAWITDTGPSAAVVGLAVFVACRYRAYVTAAVVAAAMAGEMIALPNLAGKEHLVAVAVGFLAAAPAALRERAVRRTPTEGPEPRGRPARTEWR
ncbi:hypothetical protein ACIP88_07495 [Streptomyces uncialis]|uniref:hypothetical protein n=1 Tax=Streptomyces uncialis TaxID=1048205 RepID=UPI00382B1986